MIVMDLKELMFFSQVCKDNSIRKAASNLYITHQGLSKSIKCLEKELGVELFKRTKIGIEITENGYIVMKYVDRILNEVKSMNDELNEKGNERVDLLIVVSYGVTSAISPRYLVDYNKVDSRVNLDLTEEPDLLAEKAVLEEKAEVGLIVGPVDINRFDAVPFQRHTPYLLVRKENPLSKKNKISFSDLKNESFIMFNKDFRLHHLIKKKCEEAGFRPNILIEVSKFIMGIKLCNLNYGVTITYDCVLNDITSKDLCAIPFDDEEFILEIYIVTKKGNCLSATVKSFMNYIRKLNVTAAILLPPLSELLFGSII